ncbi:hypothetical protein [Bdellovibrio sp. KM01]|uniref:hypothetical protein n=1 Tax=Bdellovibrio sp. KM01 TaxID=2748865 RepID=UPI0015EADAB2|nr:hypothetical protein [Bdellovibrio sp. KM01]QLY24094.1 hypothetical protein HW988_11495 [Bdellovibrio sp. KM01]
MKDYVQYLEEVLGLQKVMLNDTTTPVGVASDVNPTAAKIQFFTQKGPYVPAEMVHRELVFLNILTQAKESFFLPETRDLFDKMKSAMKIRNIQVLELDCTVEDRSLLPSELAQFCESKVVVVFSSFPKDLGEMIYKGPGKWIETYSPAYLLEDAAAKKVVWNDLQKVMKELNL